MGTVVFVARDFVRLRGRITGSRSFRPEARLFRSVLIHFKFGKEGRDCCIRAVNRLHFECFFKLCLSARATIELNSDL